MRITPRRLKMGLNVVNRSTQNKADNILLLKAAIFCFETGGHYFIFCKIFDHKNTVRKNVPLRNPAGCPTDSSFFVFSCFWFDVCIIQCVRYSQCYLKTSLFQGIWNSHLNIRIRRSLWRLQTQGIVRENGREILNGYGELHLRPGGREERWRRPCRQILSGRKSRIFLKRNDFSATSGRSKEASGRF